MTNQPVQNGQRAWKGGEREKNGFSLLTLPYNLEENEKKKMDTSSDQRAICLVHLYNNIVERGVLYTYVWGAPVLFFVGFRADNQLKIFLIFSFKF